MGEYRFKPRREIRVRLTRKRALGVLVVIAVIIVGWFAYQRFRPLTRVEFGGMILEFKHDVRAAKAIPVYPNEQAVNSLIFNPEVKNIFIAFKDSPDNSLVAAESVEIAYKLARVLLAQGHKVKSVKNFTEMMEAAQQGMLTIFPKEVATYEDLGVDAENPTIALVPPALTNESLVEVRDYVVFIKGKTREDFELAAIRFLTSALGIKI